MISSVARWIPRRLRRFERGIKATPFVGSLFSKPSDHAETPRRPRTIHPRPGGPAGLSVVHANVPPHNNAEVSGFPGEGNGADELCGDLRRASRQRGGGERFSGGPAHAKKVEGIKIACMFL